MPSHLAEHLVVASQPTRRRKRAFHREELAILEPSTDLGAWRPPRHMSLETADRNVVRVAGTP